MTKQSAAPRFPRHRHEWRDLGAGIPGGWRYRCALCQRRSRNPFCQLPQFRRVALAQVATEAAAVNESYTRRAIERRLQRRRAR